MTSMKVPLIQLLLASATAFLLPGITLAQTDANDWRHRDTLTGDWNGLRSSARESGVALNASYIGEAAAAVSGGERHVTLYAQQFEVEALLDMEHIANIKDARLQMTLNYRDGRSLSKEVLHNQFPVQEVYSTPQTLHLSQFNWLQHFADRRVTVQVGWSPVGNDFARLPGFCKFQNLVICGHSNAMTVNSGALNGPISQWGARIKLWPTENFYINTGAYRNNFDGFTDGGFDLSLDHDGTYYPIEFGWKRREGVPHGSIAIGAYYNSAKTPDVYYDVNHDSAGLTGLPFLQHGGRHGGYVLGEQVVYQPEGADAARKLSLVGIAGGGDDSTARFQRFAIAGAIFQGPFAHRPDDFVSFMTAWARTNPRLTEYQHDRYQLQPKRGFPQRWETVIELDWGVQVAPWLLLQPNLQYVLQPGGNDDRSDALVMGLHFAVRL